MDNIDDILNELEEKQTPAPAEEIEQASFTYDGFQVVRGQFFAHIYEPSLTFNRNRVYVNSICLRKMPDVEYVNFLVNSDDKRVLILPVTEDVADSVKWCTSGGDKRKPRQMTAKVFWAKTMSLMDWNPVHRYKVIGKMVRCEGDVVFAFDLENADIYQRTVTENEKEVTSKTAVFQADWQDSFGLPYEEHRKRLRINMRDGYAVFSMEDTSNPVSNEPGIVQEGKNEQQ